MMGSFAFDVKPFGPVHEYEKGLAPPVTLDLNCKVVPSQAAPEGAAANGKGESVPNEISSSPKSFPFAIVCRSTIEMVI